MTSMGDFTKAACLCACVFVCFPHSVTNRHVSSWKLPHALTPPLCRLVWLSQLSPHNCLHTYTDKHTLSPSLEHKCGNNLKKMSVHVCVQINSSESRLNISRDGCFLRLQKGWNCVPVSEYQKAYLFCYMCFDYPCVLKCKNEYLFLYLIIKCITNII